MYVFPLSGSYTTCCIIINTFLIPVQFNFLNINAIELYRSLT